MTDIEKQLIEYEPIVHKVIAKRVYYLPDTLEYQDLLSIGMTAIWEAIPKFKKTSKATIEKFLYRVVYNIILDTVEYNKYKPNYVFIDTPNFYETNHNELMYSNENEILCKTTLPIIQGQLNKIYIDAVDYAMQGCSISEISISENIPEGTVKSRRHRAIKQLKELV